MFEGWPVEYRAIVEKGRVMGISNYYVQRPLPDSPEVLEHDVFHVLDMTRRLIEQVPTPLRYPGGPSDNPDIDRNAVAFTADFMKLLGGDIVYLEGGPPAFYGGADPCCFADMERKADYVIDYGTDKVAIALSLPEREYDLDKKARGDADA